ncbi:PPC domain-containing protein [Isoptericola cucumis]|nr:PPC domain-containing protein [Isoptericola cucumis]
MVAPEDRRQFARRAPRRAMVLAGATALAAPLALVGVSTSSAAPETVAAPAAPGPASGPSASPGDDEHPDRTGGIDGEAMRQRIMHESPGKNAPGLRADEDALRVQEKDSGDTADDGGQEAQRLPAPRTPSGWEVRVDGSLSTEAIDPEPIAPNDEDDGAIPLARDLRLGAERDGISTTGTIGDGPHGSEGTKTGDYDFYRLDASKGETLTVDLAPGGELAANALLYDADGNLVVGAQDMTGDGAVHLSERITEPGAYYVAVGNHYPADPFDPASGPAVITEGPYDLDITVHARGEADTDTFVVPLRQGDVLGTTVRGAARQVAIHELSGELVQASSTDPGVIYPDDSPLPRGGNATGNHVVEKSGLYLVSVADGSGDYELTVGAHRAPSTQRERPQTVLLDFSGPSFDNRIFGASAVEPGVRDISPMRDFLPRWGLEKSDERAVIEATTARVREMLRDEIPGSQVRVVTSLEHPDLFGKPGVSRVIIGGDPEEAGIIPALGLSESVDPGNFARAETAIVMPGPMSGDESPISLNHFLTDDSDRVRAVAQGLGNTTGHEIGHFLGSFHTDDDDEPTNVMNTGNRLQFYAVGPDGVAGTVDDDHIAMRTSRYDPLQGISGIEDTIGRTSVALR